jgi:hypothetical protein
MIPIVTAVVRYLSGKSEVFIGSPGEVQNNLEGFSVTPQELQPKWDVLMTGTPVTFYNDREVIIFLNTARLRNTSILGRAE